VRDNALAASGLLNREIGGPSVFPYQPAGIWDELAFGREFTAQKYSPSHGQDLYRRGMYSFWKRTVPPAELSTFDAPDREKCLSRRAVTNTPLQALALIRTDLRRSGASPRAAHVARRRPVPEQRIASAINACWRGSRAKQSPLLTSVAANKPLSTIKTIQPREPCWPWANPRPTRNCRSRN
jgi:hypothetical protein